MLNCHKNPLILNISLLCKLLIFVNSSPVFANEPSRFQRLSSFDGLADDFVLSIHQDNNGFMWFGTVSGLSRFDGYQFNNYYHIPNNSNSLSDNTINAITSDSNGNLWIGTNSGGINRIDYHSQQIKHYFSQVNNSNSLRNNKVHDLYHDGQNKLWIVTSAGLDVLDTETDRFTHIDFSSSSTDVIDHLILGILVINETVWLQTKRGIYIYEPTNKHLKFIDPTKLNTNVKSTTVKTLFEDHNNQVWAGTAYGLYQINPDTYEIALYGLSPENPQTDTVLSISEDNKNRLWVATATNGLYRINAERSTVKHYKNNPYHNDTLSSNKVLKVYVSRNQTLWASNPKKGLSKLSLYTENFGLQRPLIEHNKLIDFPIVDIHEDPNGYIWVLQKTLLRFNPHTRIFDNPLESISNYDKTIFKRINNIDGNNEYLWMTTEKHGIIKYNFSKNTLKYIQTQNYASKGLKTNHSHGIYFENNSFWIDSLEGLLKYNIDSNLFTPILFAPEKLKNQIYGNILDIHTDNSNHIWIASFNGLFQLKNDAILNHFLHNPNNKKSLSNNVINDLASDNTNNLWIATNSGLNTYNDKTESFNLISTENGLPGNTIFSLLFDRTNNLWIGTNKGLAVLNTKNNAITSFHQTDGLQGDTFTNRAKLLTSDGKIIFGGNNGFNIFDPEKINKRHIDDVVISAIHLFDKKTPIADLQKNNPPELKNDSTTITLMHHENDLSITLSSLDYHDPLSNLYRFKLEGFHETWITRNAKQRIASFTNLDPGTYHLRAQASNDNKHWSKEKKLLSIIVLPPWWLSTYAYIAYVILSMGLIYLLIRLQTYRLKRKAEVLEKIVNERTLQIQQQKSLIEEQASHLQLLIKKKDQVFSHISHEFRTPLTLILGPLKNLLNKVSDAQQKSIELVQTNAYRLLRLVDQLLELSKLHAEQETPKEKHKNFACNTESLISAVLPSFQVLADNKSINLQLTQHDPCDVACSYDSLEKIITNLLSNAIKYTLEGGEIRLSIYVKENTQCEIHVKDNGLGIPEDQQNSIFEPFTRVEDDEQRESIPGTGIGLSLVKELVETHDGTIQLNSHLGEGSHFIVTLPLADAEKQIIYQKNQHIDEMNLDIIDLTNRIQQELAPEKTSQLTGNDVDIDEKRPVLLIIEDNPEMRQYIQDLCAPYYQCLLAGNGKQGMQLATDYIPDIILSDIMMPELDGHGCLKLLKADRRTCHIPVILLSALKDRENRIQGLQEKADDVLTKPFDSEELLIRLKNLLDIRDLLKQPVNDEQSLNDENKKSNEASQTKLSELDQMFLQHFEQMLEQYYTDEELNLDTMAQHLLLSSRQMQRKLKALTGSNPNEYLRDFRLNKAAEIFRMGYGVENVAYQVGFASRSYFSKCFKAKFKMTAKEYQQQFASQTNS